MYKKNTIKNIVIKILNFFKLFFMSIFSIFLSPFTKNNSKLKKDNPNKNKKQKQAIKEPTGYPTENPNTRINNHAFTKESEEIEKLIIRIYCSLLNLNPNNLTIIEKQELTNIITSLTPILNEKIKAKEINTKEELQTTIKDYIINERKQEKPILNNNQSTFEYTTTPNQQVIKNTIDEQTLNPKQKFKDESYFTPTFIKTSTSEKVNNHVVPKETQSTINIINNIQPNKSNNLSKPTIKKSNYVAKTLLKNYFVAETLNHQYVLINEEGQELTIAFPYKIIDFQDNYVVIKDKELYYIYDFQGYIINKDKFLDIKLQEEFYTVVTLNSELNIHKYNDKKFKLSNPIPLKKENIHNYEVSEEQNKLKIEISKKEIYYADKNTGILELPKELSQTKNISPLSINTDFNNEITSQSVPTDSPTIESINENLTSTPNEEAIEIPTTKFEKLEETIEEQAIIIEQKPEQEETTVKSKKEESQEKQEQNSQEYKQEEVKEQPKEEPEYEYINFNIISSELSQITITTEQEIKKEELEDKDYEMLEAKIDLLLDIIKKQEKKNLTLEDRTKLNLEKNKLIALKNKLINAQDLDIEHEKQLLNQEIMTNDLFKLELELQRLHLENQIDLNEYHIQNIEDLLYMNKYEVAKIEKKLLKTKLKKASEALLISNILIFPFLKNKYFLYFSTALFASTHLNFISNIFKRKNIENSKEDLNYIKKGQDSLDEALNITTNNIALLNELEATALAKYPELALDSEYIYYLNNLKEQLKTQELKMIRKKQMINKYNLQAKNYTRKLNKDKKAA